MPLGNPNPPLLLSSESCRAHGWLTRRFLLPNPIVSQTVCRGRETQLSTGSAPSLYCECFDTIGKHKYIYLVSLPTFFPQITLCYTLQSVTFSIDKCLYWISVVCTRPRWSCDMDEEVILWSIRSFCSAQSSADSFPSILPGNLFLAYTVCYAKCALSMESRNSLFTYSKNL